MLCIMKKMLIDKKDSWDIYEWASERVCVCVNMSNTKNSDFVLTTEFHYFSSEFDFLCLSGLIHPCLCVLIFSSEVPEIIFFPPSCGYCIWKVKSTL